ncbi:MAG TPA: HlyD family secretion protein [Candidatus Kapabacteria bacterium]|nr:HlyD family secretion protein [Candidatus Kapabacteria bacterium]
MDSAPTEDRRRSIANDGAPDNSASNGPAQAPGAASNAAAQAGTPAGQPGGHPAGQPGGAHAAAPNTGVQEAPARPRKPRMVRRIILYTILAAVLVGGGIYVKRMIDFGATHVNTDDAQVDGNIDPVLPHISGYVTAVLVKENDRVAEGAPIVEIDPRELQLKLGNAETQLSTAQAGLATARAGQHNAEAALLVAEANVKTAEVARTKAENDLARDRNLFKGNAITQQQLDATKTAFDAASAQLETARRQVGVTQAQIDVARAQLRTAETQVGQRQNDVDYARLQLSYTRIAASRPGMISKKNVEVGQYVQAGQPLLAITEDTVTWVTANFKETDLERVRVGQPAEIVVDAYPGITFEGRVQSIAAATGAKFSLLPPDNATGNFVKVTQRIPVRIAFTKPPDPGHPLRPGMSVDVTITTR